MNSYDLVLKYSIEILQNRSAVFGFFTIIGRTYGQFLVTKIPGLPDPNGGKVPAFPYRPILSWFLLGDYAKYGINFAPLCRTLDPPPTGNLGSPTAKNYRCKTTPFNVMIVQALTLSEHEFLLFKF